MRITRTRAIIVTGLVAGSMALTACSSTPTPDATSGGDLTIGSVDLAAAGCPADIKIQTDWNPEAEHGHLYSMLGADYTIDDTNKTVTGPLMASGEYTGVDETILSGGPAVGFSQPNAQLYSDDSIFMAYVGTDEAIAHSVDLPTVGVFQPLEKDPQMIMWDPATYPDVKTIADLGKTDAPIRVFPGGVYIDYFVGAGILKSSQIDATYDGSPAVFVSEAGKTAQQGFASAEPYIYKNEVPEWGKDVKYQLINDAGFPKYAAMVSVRPDDVTKYADCLKALVPVMQKAEIDYYDGTTKDATNDLILKLVDAYDTGWVYSQGVADFSFKTQLDDGIVANGPDDTLGNFDADRVKKLFDIVTPIFTSQDVKMADGLTPESLYTNQFVDMSLGLK
jgi:hypothetical protein